MPLSSVGQRTDYCWRSQISKGSKKYPKQWLWQMNFQKRIAHSESWILGQQRQKNMSTYIYAEGHKFQKEVKNTLNSDFSRWIFKNELRILNPESWVNNVRKICQHILPMTSSKGAKIVFSIELFQKIA